LFLEREPKNDPCFKVYVPDQVGRDLLIKILFKHPSAVGTVPTWDELDWLRWELLNSGVSRYLLHRQGHLPEWLTQGFDRTF
jgi:hypothetical protein